MCEDMTMEPITVKMKVADPEEISAAVIDAIQSDFGLDDVLRGQAAEIWRTVSLVFARRACILIQPDTAQ